MLTGDSNDSLTVMAALIQDFRYAVRVLIQNRAGTIVAILALALGIGANTAIFSVVHAVLLSPLPFHDPEKLVTVLGPESNPIAAGEFFDIGQARSIEHVSAAELWAASLTGRDNPEEVAGMHLTGDMF